MQEKIKISIKWIDFIYHDSNSPLHYLIIILSYTEIGLLIK